MCLQNKKADGHRVICFFKHGMVAAEHFSELYHVIQALTHFPAVNRDHVIMYPVTDGWDVIANGTLRNFTFMMRKQKIHATAVDIKLLTQVFYTHCRALDMPARKANTPRTFPTHDMFRSCVFPKCKI